MLWGIIKKALAMIYFIVWATVLTEPHCMNYDVSDIIVGYRCPGELEIARLSHVPRHICVQYCVQKVQRCMISFKTKNNRAWYTTNCVLRWNLTYISVPCCCMMSPKGIVFPGLHMKEPCLSINGLYTQGLENIHWFEFITMMKYFLEGYFTRLVFSESRRSNTKMGCIEWTQRQQLIRNS